MAPLCQHPHHHPCLNTPESCRPPSADVVSTIYTSLSTIFVLDLIFALPPCLLRPVPACERGSQPGCPLHTLPAWRRGEGKVRGGAETSLQPPLLGRWDQGSGRACTPRVCSQGPNSPRSHLPEKPDALLPAWTSSEFSKRDINK